MSSPVYENERGLLGCVLLDPTILNECTVSEADFVRPQHANLWRLVNELAEAGVDGSSMMVEVFQRTYNQPTVYDGVSDVASLPHNVPSPHAFESYQRAVLAASYKRRAGDILASGLEAIKANVAPDEVLAGVERALLELSQSRALTSDPWTKLGDAAAAAFDRLQVESKDPERRTESVIPTPWPRLTQMLRGGMRRGEMLVIAGRPGTGKTAGAMQMVAHASNFGGVLVVSLEMRTEALVERELARTSGVDHTKIAELKLAAEDWRELTRAVSTLGDAPVYVMDTPALTIAKLSGAVRQKVARLAAQGVTVRTVMVDYLQLITAEVVRGGRVEEAQLLGDISKGLVALAKLADVAVIAVAQMNRNVEARGESARPRMSDLRGSGQIEQDAAAILFTARPEDPEVCESYPDWRELVVAKARHGVTGEVPCVWHGEQMTLVERDLNRRGYA